MSKKKIALIINIIILVLEIFAFVRNIFVNHLIQAEYYTIDSNMLALISSFLFIIFYKKDLKLVNNIRFVATSCLALTFLVVIFVLCPMYNFNYKMFMFTDTFIVFHTICPILSIISYVVFEERSNKNYLCLVFTAIYGTILIILNLLNIVKGPYPFLMIKDQSLLATIIWYIILMGGSYIIGVGINFLNKKIKGAN